LLDEEGWYSVTPELIADQIAERCRCDTIIDAFCGVGGNTIAFAKTCQRGKFFSDVVMRTTIASRARILTDVIVIAFDTSPTRLALARHNAAIYGVVDRIEFILGDFLSFARAQAAKPSSSRTIDVVFLSPPWGGPEYISGDKSTIDASNNTGTSDERHPEFSLANVQPIHGRELFQLSRALTPNVALYLPRNTNLAEVSALLETPSANLSNVAPTSYPGERVEVEEEWMGSKLKALTFYFGGLALGQEDLWDAPCLDQGGTTSEA
jgi:trimethylguanosine synthase